MRTRSSYLLSTLMSAYNLVTKWEPYDDLQNDLYNTSLRKDPADLWVKYQLACKKLTSEFMATDNFALKFHSHAFFNCFKTFEACRKNKLFTLDNSDYLNLQEHIQIADYDKIYFLTRKDYISHICSYLFGSYKQKLYIVNMEKLIPYHNKPVILQYNKLELQALLIQHMLLPLFEQKLLETKLDYTKLDYDEVPSYINNNYPNAKSVYIETKFNYTNLIKNYDQIVNVIEEEKIKFQPIVDSLLSK